MLDGNRTSRASLAGSLSVSEGVAAGTGEDEDEDEDEDDGWDELEQAVAPRIPRLTQLPRQASRRRRVTGSFCDGSREIGSEINPGPRS